MTSARTRALTAVIVAVQVLLLARIWYLWRFSYFGNNDFDMLYWIFRVDGRTMLWHVINPISDFFRPAGMFVGWVMWHTFGLNPIAFHVLAWALHVCNVVLLFVLLARITGSPFGAAIGALLFGFRANFTLIYWDTGFIFELLACLFMFLALLLHSRKTRTYLSVLGVLLFAILALKSKEMAITLPAVLLLYDLTQKRKLDRKSVLEFVLLAAIGLWFAHLKTSTMAGTTVDHPYYMDLRALTLGRGYGWYFDRLYDVRLRWGAWISISVLGFLWMLFVKERRGIFFLGYLFVTLLPVVFLINHRYESYWYIPFFGFSGLVAVLIDAISGKVQERMPAAAAVVGLVAFITIAWMHYARESKKSAEQISTQRRISEEYAGFIRQISQLPQPPAGETIHYRSVSKYFHLESLTAATEAALHRTDINVDIVDAFPTSCPYCLEYDDSTRKLRIVP